jgi:hypothetical protein
MQPYWLFKARLKESPVRFGAFSALEFMIPISAIAVVCRCYSSEFSLGRAAFDISFRVLASLVVGLVAAKNARKWLQLGRPEEAGGWVRIVRGLLFLVAMFPIHVASIFAYVLVDSAVTTNMNPATREALLQMKLQAAASFLPVVLVPAAIAVGLLFVRSRIGSRWRPRSSA